MAEIRGLRRMRGVCIVEHDSRICDDAHYLSDVIAGASISYIIYKITEYIYFRKSDNFAVAKKALAELE